MSNVFFSQPQEYCLPTIPGCHADLKSISHETMAQLVRGDFDHVVEKYVIVDARYPYEYQGGHIKGIFIKFTFCNYKFTKKSSYLMNCLVQVKHLQFLFVLSGARNIYTKDVLLNTFLKSSEHRDYVCEDSSKRQILIFHCEFSKNRGPNMSRFLREQDRKVSAYPSLHYPEIYLLDKGYKQFYYNQEVRWRFIAIIAIIL